MLSGRIAYEAMFFDLGYEAGSSSGFYGAFTGGAAAAGAKVRIFGSGGEGAHKRLSVMDVRPR